MHRQPWLPKTLKQHRETMEVKVTLLGTGTSTGIPVIGCSCRVCTSQDPRDKRLRCSCLVEANGLTLLIDAGPDFRTQALRANIKQVDAVLITHHHFDHIAGLDDLRPFFFQNKASIPCYASPDTAENLRERFSYIFKDKSYPGVANLELHEIKDPFTVHGRYDPNISVDIIPIPAFHGKMPILGFRIGNFAYITDTNHIPDPSFNLLNNLDVLVLDALRHTPHKTHFSIAEALEVSHKINPHTTYFTHMTHRLMHAEEDEKLPDSFSFGYDGLTFETN